MNTINNSITSSVSHATTTIIIVNYNSGRLLARSLQALVQQTRPADRIIVVDNDSHDDSLDDLPELAGLEIIRAGSNLGFAKANNLAVEHIHDCGYLVLLNPDAFAEKDWLEKLIAAAEDNPQYHFFASKMIIDEDRQRYDGAGDLYHISGLVKRRYHARLMKDINNQSCEVFTPCAGAALYRTSSFKEVGGFDESFFCYMEDVDLGFRMQLIGYKGLYVKDAIVYHIGSAISGKQSDFSIYYGHRNLVWTYFKNMPALLLLLTLPYHLLINVIAILYFSYRGMGKVIIKAKKDALIGLPAILKKRSRIQRSKSASNWDIWSQLDKSLFHFLYCSSGFRKKSLYPLKIIVRLQNFIKVSLKNNVLAPLFYYAYSSTYRYSQLLKEKLTAVQNMGSVNVMSNRRRHVLMSPQHIQWLIYRKDNVLTRKISDIDLSIVTYNSEQWIKLFTQSLLAQSYPLKSINLSLVDNSSTDKTVLLLEKFVQQYQQQFSSISLNIKPNTGFGSGHDFAIRQGASKYLMVCNIDMELTDNAISLAVLMADSDEPRVASWELKQIPYEHPKYYDPVTLETSWSSHACVLLRRSAYEKAGGYEPFIFMYGEDVELSYRLRRLGYRLKYIPYALVKHHTYQQAGEVKPLQFSGSALSNAYIRLAYGSFYDQLLIIPLQAAKLITGGSYKGSRKDLVNGFIKIADNLSYFRSKNKQDKELSFPFRGFDYEMKREGAFYEYADIVEEFPLVSIVTRTYKGRSQWLKECISSVMNQTYENIQHVIVEDGGSTMQPMLDEIISAYAGSHYNLSYHALPKVGRSCAGNKGLDAASGIWLMFLDDDDLIMPDHVETLLSELLIDKELDAAYSLAWDVQTEVEKTQEQLIYKEKFYATSKRYYQEFSRKILQQQNYIPIQAILFKRELYEEYGGFDEDIEYLEDWLLWMKFAMSHKFKFVKKTTSLFRSPYALDEQVKRKLQFDSVYNQVLEKQQVLRPKQS